MFPPSPNYSYLVWNHNIPHKYSNTALIDSMMPSQVTKRTCRLQIHTFQANGFLTDACRFQAGDTLLFEASTVVAVSDTSSSSASSLPHSRKGAAYLRNYKNKMHIKSSAKTKDALFFQNVFTHIQTSFARCIKSKS